MKLLFKQTEVPKRSEEITLTAYPKGPVILVLVEFYLPGFKAGGPLRSIENLVRVLGKEFHFRIVTLDRDFGDNVAYPGIPANQWLPAGDAEVMYMRPGLRGLVRAYSLFRSIDEDTVLYLNSVWARRFSMLPALMRYLNQCRPRCLVLAPRGEFSPGALSLKRFRKIVYLQVARWLGLYSNVLWQASSEYEANDILRNLQSFSQVDVAPDLAVGTGQWLKQVDSEVAIASNVSEKNAVSIGGRNRKVPGRLRAVFVSRIARKKNLKAALIMLAGLTGDISFDLYGPLVEPDYWEECKRVIAGLAENIKVNYCGEAKHSAVSQIFFEHDLLLLPTPGENFGHVIVEALSSGCPVLISDQTPWRKLEDAGVGWDIPLGDLSEFRAVLQKCVDSDDAWYAALSSRAVRYASVRGAAPEIVEANRNLFRRAIAWGKKGGAVGNI